MPSDCANTPHSHYVVDRFGPAAGVNKFKLEVPRLGSRANELGFRVHCVGTYAMERVADPLPALACTTSVPPSMVLLVSASLSSSDRGTRGVA